MSTKPCPHCQKEIAVAALRCKHCRERVASPEETKRCPTCKAELFHALESCNVCGHKFGDPRPAHAVTRRHVLKTRRLAKEEHAVRGFQILAEAARAFGANFISCVMLVVIALLPLGAYTGWLVSELSAGRQPRLGGLFQTVLALMCMPIAAGGLSYVTFRSMAGKRASAEEGVLAGFGNMFRLLFVSLFVAFAVGSGALPGLLFFQFGPADPGTARLVLGMVLMAAGVAVAAALLFVAIPCEAIERPGLLGTLRRSQDLIHGHLRPILGVVVVLLGAQLVLDLGLAWVFLRERGPARGLESRRSAEPAARPKGERADQELDRLLKEFQENLDETRRSLDEARERRRRELHHAIARLPVMFLFSIFFAMSATVAYVHLRRAMEGTEPQDMVSVFD